jgi:hypothetical protein
VAEKLADPRYFEHLGVMDGRSFSNPALTWFPLVGFVFTAWATLGCVGLNLGTGSDDSTDDAGTTGTDTDGGGSTGVDCITESTTGATLCTGNSTCGTLAVDHDVYPDCGFRVVGANATLDIECACQEGMLCPVGIAASCTEAATMLQDQTEQTVCAQISEGRCSQGTGTAAASGGGAAAQNACNANCESSCAGAPACIAACGC